MAAKKTENGQEFSSSAYLVVPDPEKPSTWKLRVEDSPGKVTTAQLGMAAAALGPGFRGNKVQLSADERSAALRKLRSLYKSHGASSNDDLPPVLQQGLKVVAYNRLKRNAAKLAAASADSTIASEALKAELREDLECLQESLYLYGLSAMEGGSMSFETVILAVQDAVNEIEDEDDDKTGPGPNHPVVATFPGTAIYSGEDGCLYQVSYQMDGTEARIEGKPVEVTAEFKPIVSGEEGATQEALAEAQALIEARPSGHINTARLNRDANIIEGTVLIGPSSSNGVNHKRVYSERALKQIAAMAEGLPAFANHVPADQAFKPRPVQDLIGRHVNVRYDPRTNKVLSDLHLVEHQAPWVFALAERMGDMVGNSLVSKGLIKMEGDTEVVDDIVALRSADLVSDPASTKGLFESAGQAAAELPLDRKFYATLAEVTTSGVVEALLFPKKLWESAGAAQLWARTHGFKAEQADLGESATHYKLIQEAAPKAKARRTVDLAPKTDCPVQLVVGITTTQEGKPVEIGEIISHLKDNTEHQKLLAEHFGFVPKADAAKLQESLTAATAAVATVTAEKDKAVKDLGEATVKLDGFEAAAALTAKRTKLGTVVAEHKLGKEFGKIKGAISEVFQESLLAVDEKDWGKQLDDRYQALKGVPTGALPRSEGKADRLIESAGGDDRPVIEDPHTLLANALRG